MTLPQYIIDAYAHVTDDQLRARLAQYEGYAKVAKAKIASGNRGEVVGSHIENGRWVDTRNTEQWLNRLRSAWRQENEILKLRQSSRA
jgi:hypothetical protein